MKRVFFSVIMLWVVLFIVLPATSFTTFSEDTVSADTEKKTDQSNKDNKDKDDGEYELVTGLDFSYWAGETENIYGPGLNFGFILIPRHLELTLSLGAMTGRTWHMIPFELSFDVPFHVLEWMALYVNFGPTIMNKKTRDYSKNAWALSAGAGVELLPIGFDWGIYVEFDYNYRFGTHLKQEGEEDKPHTYGFTAGFNYRF